MPLNTDTENAVMGRPLEMFGEQFGNEESRRRFLERDYSCPFNKHLKQCVKPNNRPNKTGSCSLQRGDQTRIICPQRFYEENHRILGEVRDFIWGAGAEARVYSEIRLSSDMDTGKYTFGTLDWMITNGRDSSKIIGVEVQADGSTSSGGVLEAVEDLKSRRPLREDYKFGFNTFDTFKTFLTQMIFKGQIFDNLKMPYVAILQDEVWEIFTKKFRVRSAEIQEYGNETFLFFIYRFVERNGTYRLEKECVRTLRWVEFLYAYAVDPSLLLNMKQMRTLIDKKMKNYAERGLAL